MAARPSTTRPADPKVLTAELRRSHQISPHLRRVTLGGPGLADFRPLGHDQWFRFFFPREGQQTLALPTRTNALWYAQFLMTPKDRRPWVRNYTVRHYRPGDDPELDIDFVTHDDHAGPGARFAAEAPIGTTVGILDQGLIYQPDRPETHRLLVGDESALPAIAGIVASLPADARGDVFLELPCLDDVQELAAPEGVRVNWLFRHDDPDRVPGRLALEAVTTAAPPTTPPYVFIAGEQGLVTELRRHLVERSVPKSSISFTGYWRHGRAAPG
ncbi:NADPH-dependent ferric siderophore reductase [Stackebrandtia albiflava]|uniref:NADPH-dependent ferric siderophore reductase n=1 Tax=Stackebrandtia albiflava TaxID=406432 RepID=A0A562V225_9ACTN|nr:siderophore-interacting protein [Stackebrandtia albiflava]TWJ11928.1 NADPH-dependent ferric siderophore reductase [Stackebrandtia albiflava]